MPRLPRMALVLLLAAILVTTAALADPLWGAQPRRSAISVSDPMGLLTQLWRFLDNIWSKNGSQMEPDGMQTKNGSEMDPSGRTLQTPAPATPNRDNGSEIDPNG